MDTRTDYMVNEFDLRFDINWAWVDLTVNRNVGSDVTLLTIGDSWTWGDELGVSNGLRSEACGDTDYRISKVFGNSLAQKLGANWVQIALPGGSWDWVIGEFEKLVPQLVPQTKKIIAVLGFSDHGRELDGEYETRVITQYKTSFADTANQSIMDVLQDVETWHYQRIDQVLKQNPTVRCIAGPAFTNSIISHPTQTPKHWIDLLFDIPLNPCYMQGSGVWSIAKFLERNELITNKFKTEVGETWYNMINERRDLMNVNPLLFKRWHPREEGHERWADYLYNYIIKNQLTADN